MKEYDRFEKGAANSNSSTAILERQLRGTKEKIIITTIQKLSSFIKKFKEHPVYNKQVVIIFDECHRSQFGDMHAAIVSNFKKYYMFGFTGTPIFPANAGSVRNPKFFTTEQTFGDQLHSYTIVDAINDKNVLPFKVEYHKTMEMEPDIDDEQVRDIDRKKAFEAPERISLIAKYILEHFDQKTYRGDKSYVYNALTNISEVASADRGKVEEIKQKQRLSGFNSIFAVSSVEMAKAYYEEFRKQIKNDPTKDLKIAVIYSYSANEEEQDGILDEENPEDTSALDQTARDFLDGAINDYNMMFHTNYDTSSDKFQKRRDYKYIVSAANTAKPMIAISVSDLDKNENLINTPYATYDLRKGLAGEQPHNPEDLITKITACSPGEEGKQIWLDALNLFFCKDQKLIDYVQETVGMAAIGKVYQEHMIIAYGGGANGKSTFWNTIFRVLGNYAGKLSAEALTMNCKRNVKPEMAELKGKRLIISSEMEEGMRLNTAVVKQLCSTDEIQAEKKYKDPFSFVPSHTLVLYTNHLPKVGANDDGIWRRLVVIPFNAKITGKSDIKNYADYLFEHAGPAIMSWIIEGAKRAIDKNFHTTLPDVVEAAIQAYREDNDWLGQFLEECCEMDPSYNEKSGELYQAYRAHCMQNGEYIRSTTDFYSSMDKAGYNRIRKNTGVQVVGLKLKEGQDFLE